MRVLDLSYGSLFSGIEGFGLGFERAGFQIKWQVEQDAFCNAILKTHWPAVQRFADVRNVGAHNLQPVDCITAGVPCQDVSVAGRRKGLAGKRTGLFYEFARILSELRPAWFVFENVPGLFSSNKGRDFAEVLRVLMVECGYGVSWRVFDSRYFNVAQRRERVFIVGSLGKPCPAEILFESESGAGNTAASGEAREDIAVPLTSGSGESRPGRRMEDDFNIVSHAGINQQAVESGHVFTIQDVRGRRDKRQNGIGIRESETSYTLSQVDRHAIAFSLREDPGGTGQAHNCTYVIDEKRSGKQQQQQTEMDGAVQRDADDGAAADSDRMRDFASLPKGMDSPRYRALGNAVTQSVAYWIARRIASCEQRPLHREAAK